MPTVRLHGGKSIVTSGTEVDDTVTFGVKQGDGSYVDFSISIRNLLGQNVESLKDLTLAANKGLHATGANTLALFDLTSAGLALLDDADAAAQRTTLGLGTAAENDTGDFATAAQGALADSALQSSDIGVSVQGYDDILQGLSDDLSIDSLNIGGANALSRFHARGGAAYNGPAADTDYEIGTVVMGGNSRNVILTGRIWGITGANAFYRDFTIVIRSTTLPSKSIEVFLVGGNDINSASRVIEIAAFDDPTQDIVKIGFKVRQGSIQTAAWQITEIQRLDYGTPFTPADTLTTVSTAGLTKISPAIYMRPLRGSTDFFNAYQDPDLEDAVLITGDDGTFSASSLANAGRRVFTLASNASTKEAQTQWQPCHPDTEYWANITLAQNVSEAASTVNCYIEFGTLASDKTVTATTRTLIHSRSNAGTSYSRGGARVTAGASDRRMRFVFERTGGGTSGANYSLPELRRIPSEISTAKEAELRDMEDFTVSTLPSVTLKKWIRVTDEAIGYAIPAWSDGTNWRRATDGAVVS